MATLRERTRVLERTGTDMAESEGRFSRWSRLKTETKEEAPPELEEPVHVGQVATLPPEQSDAVSPDEEAATETEEQAVVLPEDLPEIETLEKDSDYTPFLAEGVPEALKKLALRKLWGSDPVLANLDGLNDYDEDFTIIEAIKTFVSEGAEKLKEANEKISDANLDEEGPDEIEDETEEDVEDIEEDDDEGEEEEIVDDDAPSSEEDPSKPV